LTRKHHSSRGGTLTGSENSARLLTDKEDERVILEVVLHVGTGSSPLIVDESLRRRNDGEASGRSVSSEASTRSIVATDHCILMPSDGDGVAEVSRVARLENVVADRSSESASSGSVVRSPDHSTDGNTDLHHVVVGDKGVTFDDGSFERSGPRSPIDHVDTSEGTTTGSDDSVTRDSRSESSEDDDTSISAIGYDVTGDGRSSASHRDTIGPFSRSNIGRPVGSVSLELVTVVGSVSRGTDLVVLDDHSSAGVLVTFNTVNDGPSTGFVKVRILNSLSFGVTSHLEKSESTSDPTELIASTVDLDTLNDYVLASIASSEDSARLVGSSDDEGSSRISSRVSLSSQHLVGGSEEDGRFEGKGSSGTDLDDGSSTSIEKCSVNIDVGSG